MLTPSDLAAQIDAKAMLMENLNGTIKIVRSDLDCPRLTQAAFDRAKSHVDELRAELAVAERQMMFAADRVDTNLLEAQYSRLCDERTILRNELFALRAQYDAIVGDKKVYAENKVAIDKAHKLLSKLPEEQIRELLASLLNHTPEIAADATQSASKQMS